MRGHSSQSTEAIVFSVFFFLLDFVHSNQRQSPLAVFSIRFAAIMIGNLSHHHHHHSCDTESASKSVTGEGQDNGRWMMKKKKEKKKEEAISVHLIFSPLRRRFFLPSVNRCQPPPPNQQPFCPCCPLKWSACYQLISALLFSAESSLSSSPSPLFVAAALISMQTRSLLVCLFVLHFWSWWQWSDLNLTLPSFFWHFL